MKLQEEATAKQEAERLRIEQQIQAERKASESYAAELQKQIAREQALAEAEGRIKCVQCPCCCSPGCACALGEGSGPCCTG